ncbi:MAG: tetratricopeptide repeat protein [Gammaproteobacteria bacterium]|nr:tetratricopeptide repeat protein [Gammaproteobacteria bacterium]
MTGSDSPLRRMLLSLLMGATMVSCAVSGSRATNDAETAARSAPETVEAQPVYPEQTLTDDMMFDVLLGEIAAQRGVFDVSVERYLEAAVASQDPRVAERAVQVASFARQYDVAFVAARRWVALAPDNLDARKALTALALQAGDLDEVVTQMDYLLGVSDNPEEGFRTATAVLARHADKQAALQATQQLVDRHPGNPYAWMALCRIAVLAEQLDTALTAIDQALVLQPGMPAATILKAQVLVRLELNPEATRILQDAVKGAPKNTDLRFAYGRMLLDGEDLEGARKQFARVVKQDPEYPGGLYSLALLELETRQYKAGEKHLKQLLKQNRDNQNAYYYLGYAAYEQGNSAAALDWYLKVESGDYWNQALLRATQIMADQGDIKGMRDHMRLLRQKNPDQAVDFYLIEGQVLTGANLHDEAYQLYTAALEYSPQHEDLLYSHALAAEQVGKLEVTEAGLRQILARDPDNVRALNALGYTLTDRTERHEEALTYISKAFLQKPDDPAIMDSMGWVHFRLGDLEKARFYLRQAWEKFQDGEIGAHLGEVLWMSGEQDEARRIWAASRKITPDSPVLLEVIHRLNP